MYQLTDNIGNWKSYKVIVRYRISTQIIYQQRYILH